MDYGFERSFWSENYCFCNGFLLKTIILSENHLESEVLFLCKKKVMHFTVLTVLTKQNLKFFGEPGKISPLEYLTLPQTMALDGAHYEDFSEQV